MSSADGGAVEPRRPLPTAEDVRRVANFEQATRLGSTVCVALQRASLAGGAAATSAELASAIRAMLSTSIGARGFFSVYLTEPAINVADRAHIPELLSLALDEAPHDTHRALLRTLVMSTATWAVHRKLRQESLMGMGALTSGRASRLAAAVRSSEMLSELTQLRGACRVGADALVAVSSDETLEDGSPDTEALLSTLASLASAEVPVPIALRSWAEVFVDSNSYTPEQKLAIGVALDSTIHTRMAVGDASWRSLPMLSSALASSSAALDGRAGVMLVKHRNGLLEITLSRGSQLNALGATMLGDILDAATGAAADPSVRALLLRSDDARAFSAGGDVRALTEELSWEARAAILHLEYAAIAAVGRLALRMPVVAISDGVTMGAGMGLFMAANRRLVSGRARLGMPECVIGLCPDAGVTHHLTALPPGFVGMFCALTGSALGAADALYAGLGTAHCPEAAVDVLEQRLREQDVVGLDALLAAHCEPMQEHSTLSGLQARIDAIFGQPNLEQTMLALNYATEEVRARLPKGQPEISDARLHASYEWLLRCKEKLDAGAPAAVHVAHFAMSRSFQKRVSAFTAFQMELAANQQLLARKDFNEGVSCVIGERKGEKPAWEHIDLDAAKSDSKVKSVIALVEVALDYDAQAVRPQARDAAKAAAGDVAVGASRGQAQNRETDDDE